MTLLNDGREDVSNSAIRGRTREELVQGAVNEGEDSILCRSPPYSILRHIPVGSTIPLLHIARKSSRRSVSSGKMRGQWENTLERYLME